MSGLVSIFVVVDQAGVQAMLLRLQDALSPTGVGQFLATAVDPILRNRAIERFRAEGDDAVGQWLPLAAYTQSVRASMGYGPAHPINRRTGRLENYITQTPSNVQMFAGGARLEYPGTPASGTTADKVRTAQVGTANPNTPPRPVLAVNHTDLELVLLGLATHIRDWP
jgi:hypothetical protein